MISIHNEHTAAAALVQPIDPILRRILERLLHDAAAQGLSELTHILVIESRDNEAMIKDEIGWSPLIDPIDGVRFGNDAFVPYWAWLEDLGGWFEIIVPVANDGFSYLILVEDTDDILPDLLHMCRTFSESAARSSVP